MKWVVLASLILANLVRLRAPLVRIESGLVRGQISENGKFFEYLGIPYGTVDDSNRFQAPLPPPKWSGILEAQNENTWCSQTVPGYSIVFGKPNCLKLNVYTPTQRHKLLPVMVYIHGGCFFSGSGSPFLYGGDFFPEHGVVFVGINYRLNVEGFLCLGIKEAPGNAGLKDQVAALKWVHRNIEAFGGNPNDVTLFGESAGSVSTSFLILSPSARGLFHKAILQSGSSLAPWALQHDPIKTASTLVKKLGYDENNPKEIYNILSNKTVEELIHAVDSFQDKFCVAAMGLFVPCVEEDIEGVEPIVTENPADIIISGNYTKVPMIIGHTDNEGIFFVARDYETGLKNDSAMIGPMQALQRDLQFPNEFDKNCTAEKIRRHYFSSYADEMLIMDMVNLYSDVHFKFPITLESELYSRTSSRPIYYYLFKYNGYMNMPKVISGLSFATRAGASHADELFYMFKPRGFPLPHRFLENKMVERMVTMWTNFAKYNDPTPVTSSITPFRWLPSRKRNPTALLIDSKPSTGPLWDERTVNLWNDTYNKFRRRHYGLKQFQSRR